MPLGVKSRSMPATIRLLGWTVLLSMLAACSSDQAIPTSAESTERYVPKPEQAESALRAALEAWRAGQPPGMVPDITPQVHVTDTFRKPNERLVDYEILGEVPTDKPRCYAVDLRYEPERFERSGFTVVGIEPLWIFRLEDVELLAHWEHNMERPIGAEPESADVPDSQAGDEPVTDSANTTATAEQNRLSAPTDATESDAQP